jgi:hypothetical protein
VAVRVIGSQVSVLLSGIGTELDYPLVRQVLDFLDIPVPDEEDIDQVLPAGDLSIFADLGLDEMEPAVLNLDFDETPGGTSRTPSRAWRPGSGSGRRWSARSTSLSAPDGVAAGRTPRCPTFSTSRCRMRKTSTRCSQPGTCRSSRTWDSTRWN